MDVTFLADLDQTEQSYVVRLPNGFDPGREYDIVVVLHGLGGDRFDIIVGQNCARALRDVADERNLIVVSPDYRARDSWMSPAAEADLLQILRDVKKEYKVKRTFWNGTSMGGTSVLAFAVLHPELVDGVMSNIGQANFLEFKNFRDNIERVFGGNKQEAFDVYKSRSAEYYPERLTMPLALYVGMHDEAVPPHSVLRLNDVLKEMGKTDLLMMVNPDVGHLQTYEDTKRGLEFIIDAAKK